MRMLFKTNLNFAGIHFSIQSDFSLPIHDSAHFTPYLSEAPHPDVTFYISAIPLVSKYFSDISSCETNDLQKIHGFQKRWATNKLIRIPQIWKIIKACLKNPELCHIEMAWDHIIINNYKNNQFYFFYSPNHTTNLQGPMFHAGFRNLIRAAFPIFSSFMLHGSGVIINDKAAIFLAPYEGVKTTMSKNFFPQAIISDDQIILKKENKRYFVHSTPFGSLGKNFIQCQLGAFFLLRKASDFYIKKLNQNEILKFIWEEHLLFTITLPLEIRKQSFCLLSDAICNLPCYQLSFSKNGINLKSILESF